jgi:hypothetical protein
LFLESSDSSLESADEADGTSQTDEDGTYYYEGSDDSSTVSSMVNKYHSGDYDYSSSDAYISGGVEECDDCTSAVVPVGEYDEYVQYFTTEYDEYYLVRVPVTRHDVYTIKEVPETSHSVYYTTGDYEVQDQVTECDDCTDNSQESETSTDSDSKSSSSSSDTSTTVVKSTSSTSESGSDDQAEVDTSGRKSSSSETEEEEDTSTSTSETSEDSETSETSETSESADEDEDEACEVDEEDITTTEVEEYDEYIVQEIDGGCEHCDDFLQLADYPQLSGDMTDDDEAITYRLVLVSPSRNTDSVSWGADIYDNDESVYTEEKESTANPASAFSLLQLLMQDVDNPLGRDEDELPEDYDDSGDDASEGDLAFILVGTFEDNQSGLGKVIVIAEDEEPFTIITGLDKPVGLCFDPEHEFLYVVDPTFEDQGFIYQFLIDWDDDDTFELASTEYSIVYQGANPYSCFLDEYGNLYFADATENKVNIIQYLDLWSGFTNYYVTLYSRDDNNTIINAPTGISVFESTDLFIVNSEVDDGTAVLLRGSTAVSDANAELLEEITDGSYGGWAVTVSEDYVFYSTRDGNLLVYDIEDSTLTAKAQSQTPRGLCYSDGSVYLADFEAGQITEFSEDSDEEEGEFYQAVSGAYALFCVNY